MNNQPQTPRNSAGRVCRGAVLLSTFVALPLGCARSPFADDPYTSPAMTQRLRQIDTVQLEDYQQPKAESGAATSELPPVSPAPAELNISLEQCRAWALANNLDIRVALVDPAIAQANVSREEARFEALLFGNVGYNDSRSPTDSALEGGETSGFVTDLGVRIPTRAGGSVTVSLADRQFETDNAFATLNPSQTAEIGVSLSQNLLRDAGFRVNAAPIQIAQLNSQSAFARTKLEVIRALAAVDRLYWRLYAAQQELLVRQSQHELANAQLERAERRVEQGDAAEVEILRAQAGVAEGLEAIIIADNVVKQRQRELKRLLNNPDLPMRGPTRLLPATPANPVAYRLSTDRLLDDAMAERLELLEVELALARDALNVVVNRNGTLPLAALDYRFSRSGLSGDRAEAFSDVFSEDFRTHTVGLRFEVPLGNEAALSALRSALLVRTQRLATRDQRERQIRQEVLDALDFLDAAWQRVLASRQAVILAFRVLEAERRQFDQGLNTSTDVQDAQTRLADARSNEVRALVDYQIAQIDLTFAAGVTLGSARIRWDNENIYAEFTIDK